MQQLRLSIVGFGTVGRWLATAVHQRRAWLAAECGVAISLVSVATRHDGFIHDDAGFGNVGTTEDYLGFLTMTCLTHTLPAWSRNLTSKASRRRKIYISDTGLAAHLLAKNPEALAGPETPPAASSSRPSSSTSSSSSRPGATTTSRCTTSGTVLERRST